MIDSIEWPDVPFELKDRFIMVVNVGSESHGLRIPDSDPDSIDDRDIMAVVVPPAEYYLGLEKWEGANSIKGCWDVVIYEFKKFIKLLMKQNPNVIGTLWLDPEDYVYLSPRGRALIEKRLWFQHRKSAFDSFIGYANSQFKGMNKNQFSGYMGSKRKELVERFGYDVKHAAHLVRLLHMGIEYLSTCTMSVKRDWDRKILMDIKKGLWDFEAVKEYAAKKIKEFEDVYENSKMQEELPKKEIENFVIDVLREFI